MNNYTCERSPVFRHMTGQEADILAGRRILIVLGSLELGGSERQALLLARSLLPQGAQVEMWAFSGPGRLAELCHEQGLPWRVVPLSWPHRGGGRWLRRMGSLVCLARAIRRARADLLLPYTLLPNVVCGLAWRWAGARTCIWNQRDAGLGGVGEHSMRLAVRRTPDFIANSRQGASYVQSLGAPLERVRVIPNGVELAPAQSDRATWRRRLGVEEGCLLVCMLANLSLAKDHATLLRAWPQVLSRLQANGRPALLLLAGRFDQAPEPLLALSSELGLSETVRFLGPVEDVAGLLGAVDLAVLSSRAEGCPNGVLEPMAAGLAVAGTDIPGIRDALGPAGSPLLAPPGDADALAERIVRLALDAALRMQLGAANRQRIAAEFSPQHMVEQTVELLSTALRRPLGTT